MIAETPFTAEDFRKRIQAMTDEQLIRYGKAAPYMADRRYSADGRTVEPVFKTQLHECRAEWRRRHPKASSNHYLVQPLNQSVMSAERVPNIPPIKAAHSGTKFFHFSAALTWRSCKSIAVLRSV
jgi:hypothetical protein